MLYWMEGGSSTVLHGSKSLYGKNYVQNSVTTMELHVLSTQFLNWRLPEPTYRVILLPEQKNKMGLFFQNKLGRAIVV